MLRSAFAALSAVALAACSSSNGAGAAPPSSHTPAHSRAPAHIVVVIEENHAYSQILGKRAARYFNLLARQGLLLTAMHGITHPSEPNYLGLFSGSTHGITDDSCQHSFHGGNLAAQLRARGLRFVGYAEGLPRAGSLVCRAGAYARKHAPWTDFANLAQAQVSRPFRNFPANYAKLPAVSFVVPNLNHDMHDGTIAQANAWLLTHLARYAAWARLHRSLLIVTWDEDDHNAGNHIPTIITGAGVAPGQVRHRETLYSLLRLLEHEYGLPYLGHAATAPTIPLR